MRVAVIKSIFLRKYIQFKAFPIVILIIAAAFSAVVEDGLKDSLVVIFLLLAIVCIRVIQEYKASTALASISNYPLHEKYDKFYDMVNTLGMLFIVLCSFMFFLSQVYLFFSLGESGGIIEMLMVLASLAVVTLPVSITTAATVIFTIGIYKHPDMTAFTQTDDSSTITENIDEQGKAIYTNIRKFTEYLMSCDFGKILLFFVFILFGLPVPLIATQLLLVSLLSTLYSSYAFGVERLEKVVATKNTNEAKDAIINKSTVSIRSAFISLSSIGAFLYGYFVVNDYIIAMSMCFFTLASCELLVIFPSKSCSFSGFGRKLFGNSFLNIATFISFVILLAVIYVPVLNDIFSTVPLNRVQILVCTGMCLVSVIGFELSKLATIKNRVVKG